MVVAPGLCVLLLCIGERGLAAIAALEARPRLLPRIVEPTRQVTDWAAPHVAPPPDAATAFRIPGLEAYCFGDIGLEASVANACCFAAIVT